MMQIKWRSDADEKLEQIIDYIAIDNYDAALDLGNRIIDAVEGNLPYQPNMGRPGRIEGTRELVVHRNYIVIYRVAPSQIDILDIVHAAQLFPESR